MESEDRTQAGNNNAVRRIQLNSQYEKAGVSTVAALTLHSKVPSHLEQLCCQACENKSMKKENLSQISW